MTTAEQKLWVLTMAGEAAQAQHIFPKMAACEAALESGYGISALAKLGHNLFGMKQHVHPVYGTLNLPGREFEAGQWVPKVMSWVLYPNLAECFADRMRTLTRLRDVYEEYQQALSAETPEAYVIAVSKRWSTDPARGAKCITIYDECFPPNSNADAVQDAAQGEN